MDKKSHQTTKKITMFTTKKRRLSDTSPSSSTNYSKKLNAANRVNLATSSKMEDPRPDDKLPTQLSQLIDPIMQEFKSLKETMSSQKSEISEEISRLKK